MSYYSEKRGIRTLHFSKRLKNKMQLISKFPATVVFAPMGYGKTTAVRYFLSSNPNNIICWTQLLTNRISDFWTDFSLSFASLDQNLPEKLIQLGFPEDIREFRCFLQMLSSIDIADDHQIMIVIDDYHIINEKSVDSFLLALIRNMPANFHLIICSRNMFPQVRPEFTTYTSILYISSKMLSFEPVDIQKFFRLYGLHLSKEDAEWLYKVSEGWISVIYLNLLEYIESGILPGSISISDMMHEIIYEPLSSEQKDLLSCVCIVDQFSLEQASFLWREQDATEVLKDLLDRNAFLTFDNISGYYRMHNIFLSCVRKEFELLPQNEKNSRYSQSGKWFFNNHVYLLAMEHFYNAHDYEGLMQAIEADRCASMDSGNKDKLLYYWEECPPDIRKKYPRAALSCATRLFTLGERKLATSICTEVSQTIKNDSSLSKEERNQILGECEIVLGSADFNNLQSAAQHFRRATKLMSRPSGLLNVCDTATFGSPSLLCLFHCNVGKLDETLNYLKIFLPYYLEVTGESDIGEEYILEAEILFLRGEYDLAEIALNKALYICEQRPKRGFLIISLFIACRIALMRGDYPAISSLLERMCIAASEASARLFNHTVDAAKAWIYSLLGLPDLIPDWIREGELNKSHLLTPTISTLHMIYGQVMLSKREYTRLISMSELFLETTYPYSNVLAAIYLHIQTAAAHAALHQKQAAEEHLRIALSMAMPDRLYVPFAVNYNYFEKELQSTCCPLFTVELEQIVKLNKIFCNEKEGIIKRYFGGYGNTLTKREYQVAQFAAQGMTNREIAETLYVSSETVKTQMKGVLQKLGLNSRAQLKDYPLEQFAPKQL